jgi:hypothetical protein
MNSPKDDKTRETKKDFTTRVPNNNGNRSPQRNDVITNDRKRTILTIETLTNLVTTIMINQDLEILVDTIE